MFCCCCSNLSINHNFYSIFPAIDGDKVEKKEPIVVSEQGDASVQGRANKDGKKSKKDELQSDLSKV